MAFGFQHVHVQRLTNILQNQMRLQCLKEVRVGIVKKITEMLKINLQASTKIILESGVQFAVVAM